MVGGSDQSREDIARLLERRYAGHLGALPCVQQSARECCSTCGVSSGFHAPVADFAGYRSDNRYACGAEERIDSGGLGTAAADLGGPEQELAVSRFGFM